MAEEKERDSIVTYVCQEDCVFRGRWYARGSLIKLSSKDKPNHTCLTEMKSDKPITGAINLRDVLGEKLREKEAVEAR